MKWFSILLCLLLLVSPAPARSSDPSEAPAAAPPEALPPDEEADRAITRREEVVVTATRGERAAVEVPAAVVSLDMRKVELNGFYVAGDELRGQPGLFFRRGEGDNDDFMFVNIRGVTGNHGNDTFVALIDGIPFVYPNEEVYMSHIPYQAVGNIEIVRGPVSALYGRGGIAGAINYLTPTPTEASSKVRIFGGSDTYLGGDAAIVRPLGSKTRLLLSGAGQYGEGWREHNARHAVTVFGKSVSQLSPGSALTLWVNYLDKRYETGSPIPTYEDGTLVPVGGGREAFLGNRDTHNATDMLFTAGRFDQKLSDQWSWQTTLHFRSVDQSNQYDFYDSFGFQPERNVMTLNGFGSVQDTTTAFAETQFRLRSRRVNLVVGANYERGTLQEEDRWTGQNGFTFECDFVFYANEVDWTTGQLLNRDHPCFVENELRARTDSTNTFYSAFAQAELALHDRVRLTLGGRYDRFERESQQDTGVPLVSYPLLDGQADQLSPKIALSVRMAAQHFAYATYGEGFNSNFGPIWQWDPSQYLRQDVEPTSLENYEIGFKGNAGDTFSYGLAGFFIRQTNRPVFLSNPAAFEDFTQPPTIVTTGQLYESRGIEVSARGRAAEGTTLFANYSLIDAKWKELVVETFEGTLDLSGNRPQGVPRHVFSAGIEQRLGRAFRGRAWWESYSDYFITQDNSRKGGGYGLLNASLTWLRGRSAFSGATLTVTNLLDEEYYYFFGNRTSVITAVPGVPFQARLTVDFSF